MLTLNSRSSRERSLQPSPGVPGEGANAVIVPLIVWLLIQLAAIALAASDVRLSAKFPEPPRSLAVHEMLIAQFVGAAIFLPVLLRGWRSWLAIAVAAGPMLMLASTVAGTPVGRVAWLWLEVAAWLMTLAAWRAIAPRRTDIVSAAATFLSAGGLLLWYLHTEFQPGAPAPWLRSLPLVSPLNSLGDPSPSGSPFPSTFLLAAASLIILAGKPRFRRKSDQPAAPSR
jgi:hypothetical protein